MVLLETREPAEAPAARPSTAGDVLRAFSRPDGTLMREALLTVREACLVLRLEKPDGRPNRQRLYQLRHESGLRANKRGGSLLFRLGDLLDFCQAEAPEPFQRSRRRG